MTVNILIGIPASGKSTFANDKRFSDCVRINLDSLRTRHREMTLLEECFDHKKDIVVDNTNVTRKERERYIKPAKQRGYRIEGYFLQSIVKDCIRRNALRDGDARIPANAVVAKSNQLEMPAYDEGFDMIHFVKMTDNGFEVSPWNV